MLTDLMLDEPMATIEGKLEHALAVITEIKDALNSEITLQREDHDKIIRIEERFASCERTVNEIRSDVRKQVQEEVKRTRSDSVTVKKRLWEIGIVIFTAIVTAVVTAGGYKAVLRFLLGIAGG
jgi:hypothetical protein